MAEFYKQFDDVNNALQFYLQILKIQEKHMGEEGVEENDLAETLFEIGLLYENNVALGNKSLAKDFFKKAFNIREKLYGKEDPRTLDCYTDMN